MASDKKKVPFEQNEYQIAYVNGSKTTPSFTSSSIPNPTGNKIVSHEYNHDSGCWVITFQNPVTSLQGSNSSRYGFMANDDTLERIISLPSCLETICDRFCYECKNLITINMRGLHSLKTIGDEFCYRSTGLKKIYVDPETQLEIIGESFLRYTDVDMDCLTMISSMDSVPAHFMESWGIGYAVGDYTYYDNIFDISKIKHLKSVGDSFFSYAHMRNLSRIYLMKNLTAIPNDFFAHGIFYRKSGDMNGFDDYDWMQVKQNIVETKGLENVTSIGNNFLAENRTIFGLTCEGLTGVKTIGNGFLQNVRDLEVLDLHGLENVETIGSSFLNWVNYDEIDLRPIKNATFTGGDLLTSSDYNTLKIDHVPMYSSATSAFGSNNIRLNDLYIYCDEVDPNIEKMKLYRISLYTKIKIHVPANLLSGYQSKYRYADFMSFSEFVAMTDEELNS